MSVFPISTCEPGRFLTFLAIESAILADWNRYNILKQQLNT